MKKIIILIFLTSQLVMGRDILIGDRIDIVISGTTEDNIRRVFKEFEIEDIKKVEKKEKIKDLKDRANEFKVSLRSYTVGESLIDIGNKRLVLNIISSLEEGETDLKRDLSTGEKPLEKKRFPMEFLAGIILLVSTLIFILFNYFKKDRYQKFLSPKEKFNKGLNSLGMEGYTYEISYLLREYADHLKGSNFLSGKYEKSNDLKELNDFLKELDHMKFSRRTGASKEILVDKAKGFAKIMESSFQGENGDKLDRKGGKDV